MKIKDPVANWLSEADYLKAWENLSESADDQDSHMTTRGVARLLGIIRRMQEENELLQKRDVLAQSYVDLAKRVKPMEREIEDLRIEVAALESEMELWGQSLAEVANALDLAREALNNCRVERDEPDGVKHIVDEALAKLNGDGEDIGGRTQTLTGSVHGETEQSPDIAAPIGAEASALKWVKENVREEREFVGERHAAERAFIAGWEARQRNISDTKAKPALAEVESIANEIDWIVRSLAKLRDANGGKLAQGVESDPERWVSITAIREALDALRSTLSG